MLFPKRERRFGKYAKSRAARTDLPPVRRERQLVLVLRKGRLPDIVVPLPQVARAELIGE
jgi:hypothetical protein